MSVGAAGCGSDDDGGDGERVSTSNGAQTAQPDRKPPAKRDGDGRERGGVDRAPAPAAPQAVQEREGSEAVENVYEGVEAAVEAGVPDTAVAVQETLDKANSNESLSHVCELMSKEAIRQTVVYARRSAGLAGIDWTCEKATGLLLRRARQSGGLKATLRARVVGVNVEGNRATASIRFGRKGPISSVPMVREDGKWKLGAAPGAPSDGGGE